LIYIDGFAGTGERTIDQSAADLFGEDGVEVSIDGSARIALKTDQPFDQHYFIESRSDRIQALNKLKELNADREIDVLEGDANILIKNICRDTAWRPNEGAPGRGRRAVLFLDPYGLDVEWDTLVEISKTKAIDVWYLFSIEGLYRQAAHDFGKVDEAKAACLDRILGTTEWRKTFYSPSSQNDLFIQPDDPRRAVNIDGLQRFVTDRLSKLFPYVAPPLPLPKSGGPQRFSLYFFISNPDGSAIGLSRRIAGDILLHI
jgi:three-Cys-motif partner protein